MKRFNDKGSALVLVVFTMMIVFFLGFALLEVSTIDFAMSNNQIDGIKAYYIAEAGMNKALAKIKTDQGLLNDILLLSEGQSMDLLNEEDFGGGVFFGGYEDLKKTIKLPISLTVKEYKLNEYLILQIGCTGMYNKALKNLKAQIKIGLSQGLSPLSPTSALISDGTTEIAKSVYITGDIYSRDDVTIAKETIINGNIISGALVNMGKDATATSITSNYPEGVPVFPTVTSELYKEGATILDPKGGSMDFSDLPGNGKYYVPDNVTSISIKGTYTGKITLISKGNITIIKNVTAKDNDFVNNSLSLISFSDININKTS